MVRFIVYIQFGPMNRWKSMLENSDIIGSTRLFVLIICQVQYMWKQAKAWVIAPTRLTLGSKIAAFLDDTGQSFEHFLPIDRERYIGRP